MNILEKAREDINRIDSEIAHLFEERMAAVASVAAYKAENGLPILDAKREREVIEKGISRLKDASLSPYYERFQEGLMAVSRERQAELLEKLKKEGEPRSVSTYRKYRLSVPGGFYDIHFDREGLSRICEYFNLSRRVLVLTDSGVPKEYAERVLSACAEGYIVTVPEGEESKSLETLKVVEDALLSHGFTRHDALVAVGGGVVGDLGALCASLYMRGIDFYNVPTTVLSMVDSSVGGKCAVNFEGVKNILGAFYQPKGVLIDPNLLCTLPKRQISAGLAEVVKIALTSDAELFSRFEEHEITLDTIDDVLYRAVVLKAKVVCQDEKEAGLRKILNFGHTYGHAIESYTGMSELLHGECVALGMLPMCSENVRKRLLGVLTRLDLPTTPPSKITEILPLAMKDKKRVGNAIDCVLVDEVGSCRIQRLSTEEFAQKILHYDN